MTVKNLFPISFKYKSNLISMLIGILIYLVIGAIAGALIGFAGPIFNGIPLIGPIVSLVVRVVCAIIDLWSFVGIILLVLAWLGIVK